VARFSRFASNATNPTSVATAAAKIDPVANASALTVIRSLVPVSAHMAVKAPPAVTKIIDTKDTVPKKIAIWFCCQMRVPIEVRDRTTAVMSLLDIIFS